MAKLLSPVIGLLLTLTIYLQAALAAESSAVIDPLPSWNEGAAKQAIGQFVAKVIKPDSPDFVPITERIAVFDNDGTLWGEQPMSVQFLFALDRVKALVTQLPLQGIPRPGGCIRSWSISPWFSCWPICGRTVSRPSLSTAGV